MIVISGALVLVALVLLIFGITTTDLDFVYASIVVSLVSFGFLLIGILQRRGDRGAETPASASAMAAREPAAEDSDDAADSVTPVPSRVRQRAGGSVRVEQPAEAPTEEILLVDDLDEELARGTVLVVPGRPRYHVAGCRYLTGKSASEVEVADAREEGFSPCGVCKPDDALAAEVEPVVDEEPAPEPEPVAAVAPARRPRATAASRKAPAKRSPRPARAGSARTGSTRTTPSPAAVAAAAEPTSDAVLETVAAEAPAASSDGAAASSDGAAPAAGSRRTGNVVIIPDRGKFHRAECRYVRNAEGTSTLSRTAATRQGYDACGVCKP